MNRLRQGFLGLLLILFLVGLAFSLSFVNRQMSDIRLRDRLIETEVRDNAPPALAITVQLFGAFRGLAADWLWLRARRKHGEDKIKPAYGNFLVDAVVILYTFGRRTEAGTYFEKGRTAIGRRFSGPLDDFVLAELAEDMRLASDVQAQLTVHGLLLQPCAALATDEPDDADAYERLATKLWHKYMSSIGESTKTRRGLPPLARMKRQAVEDALRLRKLMQHD